MAATLDTKINDAALNILKTIELAKKYGGEESKDPKIYKHLAEELCKIQCNADKTKQIVEGCKDINTVKEFDNLIAQVKGEKIEVKKTSQYKMLNDQITELLCVNTTSSSNSNISHENDEELVIENVISCIDPISKRRIETAVKNSICNHHYDKATILESIKMNPRLRCPVAGCPNKQSINEQCLEADLAFSLKLQRSQI